MSDLKDRAFAGGTYMVVRTVASMVIGLVGVLLLTRLIGPRAYGQFAGSLAFVILLVSLGRAGMDIYLVRNPVAPQKHTYDQALTILIAFGISVAIIAAVVLPVILTWVGDSSLTQPLRVLLIAVPLNLVQTPPLAMLERALNYRAIALQTLGFQAVFYVIAVPLAASGLGVWAPVTAWLAAQVIIVPMAYVAAHTVPRLTTSLSGTRQMLTYSLSYAAANWAWEARPLVNPLLVGHFYGSVGVGYVSLAMRIVDMLSFAKAIGYRLSIAVFAKVADDLPRLRRGIEESMTLQVMMTAPPLIIFCFAAKWLIPLLFGKEWLPAAILLPYLATSSLVNAVFNGQVSALYVVGRNRSVAVFHALNVVLLVCGAALLLPRLGLRGYGVAELLALGSYIWLDRAMRTLFRVSYARAGLWFSALTPPLYAVFVPVGWKPLLFLPLLALLLHRSTRRELEGYVRLAMRRLPRSPA